MSTRALDTQWERNQQRMAWVVAVACFVLILVFSFIIFDPWKPASLAVASLGSMAAYFIKSRKLRRRREIIKQPFPAKWEGILNQWVLFFKGLGEEDKVRFRRELQIFIEEKQLTGIGTTLDDETRVLAAASAIIPIFGYRDWEWTEISEVLIYPDRFGRDFQYGSKRNEEILGMVGTGAMNRIMILSKPDLLQGFKNPVDKRNVGIHEFAHLVDKTDGAIDGLPGVGLDKQSIGPWIELVRRKMAEIKEGESDIDPYALTNESEFFAVTTEYFFERPAIMERKHPELFAMMSKIFNQSLGKSFRSLIRDYKPGQKKFGRNSPCPCGSGKKYKKCCLKNS